MLTLTPSTSYLVIEVMERYIVSVTRCNGIPEAIQTANNLLENHVKSIGDKFDRLDDFRHGRGEFDMWGKADEKNLNPWNAWCNWDKDWDALIVPEKNVKPSHETMDWVTKDTIFYLDRKNQSIVECRVAEAITPDKIRVEPFDAVTPTPTEVNKSDIGQTFFWSVSNAAAILKSLQD